MHDLGVLQAIAPGLDGGIDTKVRIAKWDDLREHHAPDLPAWRGRLGLAARALDADDLDALLGRLGLAARDREAMRAVARARGPLPTRGSRSRRSSSGSRSTASWPTALTIPTPSSATSTTCASGA